MKGYDFGGLKTGGVSRERGGNGKNDRLDGQLESVAKISDLQYIEVLQSYGNPIY